MSKPERAQPTRPSTRPALTLFDVRMASIVTAVWCLLMRGAFDRNGAGGDILLFAGYLASYFVGFLLMIAILRVVASMLVRRPRHAKRVSTIHRLISMCTPLCVGVGALV